MWGLMVRSMNNRILYLVIFVLFCITGCAKKEIIRCPTGEYEAFIDAYKPQYTIDSLTGNGNYEVIRDDDEFFGNFSIFYYEKPKTWGITFYGFFGMIMTQITIKDDSFTIFSPMLDKPIKGLLKDFDIEEYTAIPIDPDLVQLLTTGRVPTDASQVPSHCIQKNKNLMEFSFEKNNNYSRIGWSQINKRIEYFICGKKGEKDFILVKFRNYRETSMLNLPYSIQFIYKGKKEAYLKLNYKFMEVNQ